MSKQDIILLITEGEKLDINILKKVKDLFFKNKNVKIFPVCLDIYNLYQKMTRNDDFGTEFMDTLIAIKEICKEQENSNSPELLLLQRNEISEMFLFFDYDGHSSLAKKYPNCINEMLTLFSDETGNGKLYINYPMVESYKHLIQNKIEVVDIFPKEHYKTFVAKKENCIKKAEQLTKLSKKDWLELFLPHLKSTNDLLHQEFKLPSHYSETQIMSQSSIYAKQKEKYIEPNEQIMVLSSFSWFLLEYLGKDLFNDWQAIDNREKQ